MIEDPRQFAEELTAEYNERRILFESALLRVHETLHAIVTDRSKFSPSQQRRNRVERGRIKESARLLMKAQSEKYNGRILRPADAFDVLTDIVGTRITCNTVEDVRQVVEAIRDASSLKFPQGVPDEKCYEDYISQPKDSGYRAVHLLVEVEVPAGSAHVPITCEIQIRTLLQNAWGELTHEDTFKPGVKVPPLVSALSKRLATTLAVLDEIAQDLRDELAKIEGEALLEVSEAHDAEEPVQISVSSSDRVQPMQDSAMREAFEDVMGRSLNASPAERRHVRRVLADKGICDRDSLAIALSMVRTAAEQAFLDQPALLPDIDYLFAAEKAPNAAAIEQSLAHRSRNFVDKIEHSRQFYDKYSPGEIYVGTAVRVKPRYALIQLSTGDTGTLSVRHIERASRDHLNLEDFVAPGDTLQVEVVNSDFAQSRIELRPLDDLQSRF